MGTVSVTSSTDEATVRNGVVSFYEQWISRSMEKNLPALLAMLADTFRSVPPNGQDHSKSDWASQVGGEFERWQYRDIHFTIEKLSAVQNEAVAYVTKRYVTTEGDATPEARHYLTTALVRERLVRSGDGYQLLESDAISRQLLIDGRQPNVQEIQTISALMQQCSNPE